MIRDRILDWACERSPDFVIGGNERPYLLRWFLIPRNPIFNIYVHLFLRSDDDRALHDHPWLNLSILLKGSYTEHTIKQGGINRKIVRRIGDWVLRRSGKMAHRIELTDGACWTLFITGPRYREWGFHCVDRWVPWYEFTKAGNSGDIGRGCEK